MAETIAFETINDYGLVERISKLEFIPVPNAEELWLEGRKKHLGGSEAAAVLGMNKYSSPLQVYKDKIDNIKKDLSKNVNVRKGKELEDWILETRVKPHFPEYKILKPAHTMINTDYPWLSGSLDAVGVLKNAGYHMLIDTLGIEIKFVSSFASDAWGNFDEGYCGVPKYYWVQVQQYMLITGIRTWVLAAHFEATWDTEFYPIPFDAEFANNTLIPKTREFWENHIEMQIPPMISPSIDTPETLAALATPISFTENVEFTGMVMEFAELNTESKRIETLKDELKNRIIQGHLEGQAVMKDSGFSVSISEIETSGFDKNKFAIDHPEMVADYATSSKYVRCTVRAPRKKK